MVSHASCCRFVVSRQRPNRSRGISERLTFRPTPHRGGRFLRRRAHHCRTTSAPMYDVAVSLRTSRTAPRPHPFLYSKGNSSAATTQVDCVVSRSPFCCSWLFSTSKLSPPRTPRVYSTYLDSSGVNVDLEFIELLEPSSLHRNPNPTLLFLAKNPADSESSLLVKLVTPECYGETVHCMLAERGLAPLLHGTACVAGAPSAIVMEYLDANSGWTTLETYIKEHQEIMINTEHPKLVELLETMKTKGVVHGDLRPNNIMCRELPDRGKERGELEIKVIDFDWAGQLGMARYPVSMNQQIPWCGNPLGFIGEDDDKELLSKTLAKLYTCGD